MTTPDIPYYNLPAACDDKPTMVDWLNEEQLPEDEACRPCIVPLLGKWYVEELQENGLTDESTGLVDFMEQDDVNPLQLAERLDSIKETIDPNLVNRLRELDCEVQVNADTLAEVGDG